MTLAALLAAQLFLLGTLAVAPWRMAEREADARRLWSLVCIPLLLLSLLLALFHLSLAPDAGLYWGIAWPPRTSAARVLLVTAGAGAAVGLLTAIGGRSFEPAAWRVAALLSGIVAAGAAFGGELLRAGASPTLGMTSLITAAGARFALSLAAGEAATGSPRWLAPLAGLLLPLTQMIAAPPIARALSLDRLTLGAACALLVLSRFAPVPWRRGIAIAGVLLAALYLARFEEVSAMFGGNGFIPESSPSRP